MTTLESLARTIAAARHGTDAMWANYMGAAEAVMKEIGPYRMALTEEECRKIWEARAWSQREALPHANNPRRVSRYPNI